MTDREAAVSAVGRYFGDRFDDHGLTPQGVDYGTAERQEICFRQLAKLLPETAEDFSLVDYGCGYGALYDWLTARRGAGFSYRGFDIVAPMVEAAAKAHPAPNARFTDRAEALEPADYVIASGIFNVRVAAGDADWLEHIKATLDAMWALARKGMAFNILTSYSDADKLRDHLYYADPCLFFDHCKRRYSRNVALLHDYEVYEFTMLVRRTA